MATDRAPLPTPAPRPAGSRVRTGDAATGLAAVLWDMDGTLVDTEPFWIRAETELVTAHGGTWTQDDAHALVGLDLLDAAGYIRRVGGVDMAPAAIVELMMERVVEQMAATPPWRPGALDLLAALRDAGIPSVLVTMSWRRLAGAVVDMLPPGSFAATVAGDEVERGKPHPEPYLAAADIVGVAPGSCVAIEDSPTGARSARSAGCAVLGVPHVVDIPNDLVDETTESLTTITVESLRSLVAR
jgi:HAD superfamily hydrolase (TIGR01509 family)